MNDLPDHDPLDLRARLRRAVPDGPDPAGRADAVVRRAHRANRRRGGASAAGVAIVALSVILGPHLIPSGPVSNGATIDTSRLAARLAHPFSCPTPTRSPAPATVPAADQVPAGAVLARICPVLGSGLTRWSAPLDALTTGVGTVADAYNGLPKGLALPCPFIPDQIAFSVTFQYADGALVRVTADSNSTGGCSLISVDGRNELGRADAGTVMTRYFAQLQRQRSRERPPDSPPGSALSCPTTPDSADAGLLPVSRRLDLTRAIVCLYPASGGGPVASCASCARPHQGTLTGAQVRLVNQEWAREASHGAPLVGCTRAKPRMALLGIDAWGDRVWLLEDCITFVRNDLGWTPSASVQAMLARVAG